MAESLQKLAKRLQFQPEVADPTTQETIEVSVPASTAASLYERVRNTLDYQDEHLLRRNAILRILKRYLGTNRSLPSLAGELLKELVWAGYLPNKTVPVVLKDKLAPVIGKYEHIFRACFSLKRRDQDMIFNWWLDVLATEIETVLAPKDAEEALVAYMYEQTRQRSDWDPRLSLSTEQQDLRLYIATHATLLKSNPGMLRYRVLTLYYPEWPGEVSDQLLQEIAGNLAKIVYTVEYEIHNPLTDRLSRILRRKAGIYRVLNDVLLNTDLEKVLKDPESIDQAVASALGERTKGFKVRLRRTVVRAVMFLFITKMLLALMIELPYDLFLTHEAVPIYPLLINISFPPLFLALIGLTISIPYKKNIKDYQAAIRALASGADHQSLHLRLKQLTRSSWQILYDGLYAILFIGVYGVIAVGLSAINFHWLSITLFLFFLSLVTFFGIRIRMSTRDIVASDRRSGLVGTMFDILSLPVVRAGAWLSTKISSINVFIYFFDFIIEAPLKVAIQFVESWLVFIRDKKEEI